MLQKLDVRCPIVRVRTALTMEAAESDSGHSAEAENNTKMTHEQDIVRGFIKEKELIESAHKEEVEELKSRFQDDKLKLRQELESEKEKLEAEFEAKYEEEKSKLQYEAAKTREAIGKELHRKETRLIQQHKEEVRKLKREYEKIVQDKRNEIGKLSRDVQMYQQKALHHESAVDASLEMDALAEKYQRERELMTENHEQEVERLREEFQFKLAEHERELQREGANFVQMFGQDAEKLYMDFEAEKAKMKLEHEEELKTKLETVERLLSEQAEANRNRMIKRFEDEMICVEEELKRETTEKLFEKQRTIQSLEKEKEDLIHTLHLERFSLARVYNREMSLLTKPDPISKEDLEVALIDEVAKVRHEYDVHIQNMEARQRQEVEEIRESQRPLMEIEDKHKKDLRDLRRQCELEKDALEATLRREQFNLLKSFEFEKHDLERVHGEILEDKEEEFSKKCRSYEKEIGELRVFAEERHTLCEELEKENGRNGDLQDLIDDLKSKKSMLEDELEKMKRKCLQLQFESQQPKEEGSAENAMSNEDKLEDYAKLADERSRLREELDLEKEKTSEMECDVEELKKKLANSEDNVERANSENVRLNTAVAELEQKLTVGRELLSKEVSKPTRPANDQGALEAALELEKYGLDEQAKRTLLDRILVYIEKSETEETEKDSLNKCTKSTKESKVELEEKIEGSTEHELESHAAGAVDRNTVLEDLQVSAEHEEAIKDLVKALETKDNEIELLQGKLEKQTREVLQRVSALQADLREVAAEDADGIDEVEDSRVSIQKMNDAINKHIQQVEKLCADSMSASSEGLTAGGGNASEANEAKLDRLLDNTLVVGTLMDKETKDKVNEYVKDTMLCIRRKHELKRLKIKRRYLKEKSVWLEEQSQDKKADLRLTEEALRYLEEKFQTGKEMQNENADKTTSQTQQKDEREFNASGQHSDDSSVLEQLTRENEHLRCSLSELGNNFEKEKEKLMRKMCSQHKEFVMSPEAEVIETLIKERSALEHTCNVERFYLSRLYYREMKDELRERLAEREKKTKEGTVNIALKFEKEISDLQSIIVQKNESELKLTEDKEDLMKQLLEAQKGSPPGRDLDEDEGEHLRSETARLQAMIPLKEEIADLQSKRHMDHEALIVVLKEAYSLIKELMENNLHGDNFEDSESFQKDAAVSEDGSHRKMSSPGADDAQQDGISQLQNLDEDAVAGSIGNANTNPTETLSQDTARGDRMPTRDIECTEGSVLRDDVEEENGSPRHVRAGENPIDELCREPQPMVSAEKPPVVDSGKESAEGDTEEHCEVSSNQSPSRNPLDEIKSQEELRRALEDLVERVIRDDKEGLVESEFTSGASSDVESDTSQPASENEMDELTDSGAELVESETLTIKKAKLDLALNLERFNLGRIYYAEFRDSLNKATAKLAEANDSLQNKGKNLEQVLLSEFGPLVEKTRFGRPVATVDTREQQTQTPYEERRNTSNEKEDEKSLAGKEAEEREGTIQAIDTANNGNDEFNETDVNTTTVSEDENEAAKLQQESEDIKKHHNTKGEVDPSKGTQILKETEGNAGPQEQEDKLKPEGTKEIQTEESEKILADAGEGETNRERDDGDEGSAKVAEIQKSGDDEAQLKDVDEEEDDQMRGKSSENDGEDNTELEKSGENEAKLKGVDTKEGDQEEMRGESPKNDDKDSAEVGLEREQKNSEQNEEFEDKYKHSDGAKSVGLAKSETLGKEKNGEAEKKNSEAQTDPVEIRSDIPREDGMVVETKEKSGETKSVGTQTARSDDCDKNEEIPHENEMGGKAKEEVRETKTTGTQTAEGDGQDKEEDIQATKSTDEANLKSDRDSNEHTVDEGNTSMGSEKTEEIPAIHDGTNMSTGEVADENNSEETQGNEGTVKYDTDGSDEQRGDDGEKGEEKGADQTSLEPEEGGETTPEEDESDYVPKDRSEEPRADEEERDGSECSETQEEGNLLSERENREAILSPECERTQHPSAGEQECLEEAQEGSREAEEAGRVMREQIDPECSTEVGRADSEKDDKIKEVEDLSPDTHRVIENEDGKVDNEIQTPQSVSEETAGEETCKELERGGGESNGSEEDHDEGGSGAVRKIEDEKDDAKQNRSNESMTESKECLHLDDDEKEGSGEDSGENGKTEKMGDTRITDQETSSGEQNGGTISSEHTKETRDEVVEPMEEQLGNEGGQEQDVEDDSAVTVSGEDTQQDGEGEQEDKPVEGPKAPQRADEECGEKDGRDGVSQSPRGGEELTTQPLNGSQGTTDSLVEQEEGVIPAENREISEDVTRENDKAKATAVRDEPDNGKEKEKEEGKEKSVLPSSIVNGADDKAQKTGRQDMLPGGVEEQQAERDNATGEGEKIPQDAEGLIKKLRIENNQLKDKFNILQNLVGKGFVREIPELCDNERLSRILDGWRTLDENELCHLYDEKEKVTEELTETEREIESLRSSDQNEAKDVDDELNRQELEALKELETLEKTLKKNEDRDLIQHLLEERENVGDRLEEIRKEMEQAQRENQDHTEGSILDLMTKEDLIKEKIREQQAQLRSATRQQADHQENMAAQSAALEQSIDDHTSQSNALGEALTHKPGVKRQKRTRDANDDSRRGRLPDGMAKLIKSKVEASKKGSKLTKDLQKAHSDIGKYRRMIEDQQNRLKPFTRKQDRLEKALGSLQGNGDTTEHEGPESSAVPEQQLSTENQQLDEAEKMDLENKLQKLNIALQRETKKVRSYHPRRSVSLKKQADIILAKRPHLAQENEMVSGSLELESKKLREITGTDTDNADVLIDLMHEKEKLQRELQDVNSALRSLQEEENRELTENPKMQAIVRRRENLRAALIATDEDIQEEEVNICEALKFKRNGHTPQQRTPLRKLVNDKERLLDELKQNNQIMLSAVEQVPTSLDPLGVEEAAERMVTLQAEIENAKERIDAETTRAMEALSRLLGEKSSIGAQLAAVEAELTEERATDSSHSDREVGEVTGEAGNDNATHKGVGEICAKRNLLEEEMKQVLTLLVEAEKSRKDPEEYEEKLEKLIGEKVILDADFNSHERVLDNAKLLEETVEGLERKRAKISKKLTAVESEVASHTERGEHEGSINTLGGLFRSKVNIEADLRALEKIADLVQQKECVVERLGGKHAHLRDELFTLMRTVRKRENDIEVANRKLKDEEELSDTIGTELEAVQIQMKNLDNEIAEEKRGVDEALEGLEKERIAHENEEQEMRDTVAGQQNELERSYEELKSVDEQFQARKKQIQQGTADVSDQERLYVEKNIVADYLDEIELKLRDYGLEEQSPTLFERDRSEELTSDEMAELQNQSREIEERLREIQKQRAKQELDSNDQEIEQTMNTLMASKEELEKKRNDLLDRILGSGPFAKLACGREIGSHDDGNDDISSYHEILDKVIAEDLTLISQIQKAQAVRGVAQRQRDLTEKKLGALTSNVGPDLVMHLVPDAATASKLPTVQRNIVDRALEDGMSISDVLSDVLRENEELRDLSDNLEKQLGDIREKLGEEFASQLTYSSIGDEDGKYSYIVEEIERDSVTVGELLRAEDEKMDVFEANVGEDLTSALMAINTGAGDPRETTDFPLRALALMKENNDDLQRVIEVYEMQLDTLNHENDEIKAKLGKSLVNALMRPKPGKTRDGEVVALRGEGDPKHNGDDMDSDRPSAQKERTDDTKATGDLGSLEGNLQEREETDPDSQISLVKSEHQEPREDEPKEPGAAGYRETSAKELKAPKIANEQHDTLADVIAQYERELDILRSNIGPYLCQFLLATKDSKGKRTRDRGRKQQEQTGEELPQTAQKASARGEGEGTGEGTASYGEQLEDLLRERGTVQALLEAQEKELKELREFREKGTVRPHPEGLKVNEGSKKSEPEQIKTLDKLEQLKEPDDREEEVEFDQDNEKTLKIQSTEIDESGNLDEQIPGSLGVHISGKECSAQDTETSKDERFTRKPQPQQEKPKPETEDGHGGQNVGSTYGEKSGDGMAHHKGDSRDVEVFNDDTVEISERDKSGKELDEHTTGTSDTDRSGEDVGDGEVETSEVGDSGEGTVGRSVGTSADENLEGEFPTRRVEAAECKEYKEEFEKLRSKLGNGLTEALLLMGERSATKEKSSSEAEEGLESEKKTEKKKRKRSFFSMPFRKKSKKASQSKCSLQALGIMQKDNRTLESVVESYENEIGRLKKSSDGDGGSDIPSGIVSEYEDKITMLKEVNQRLNEDLERHSDLEKEYKKLQEETDGLCEVLGSDLSKDIKQLNDINRQKKEKERDPATDEGVNKDTFLFKATLESLQEGKPVGDIIERYEEDLRNLERENEVLRRAASQGNDGSSLVETISDYENQIKELERTHKNLERKYGLLSDRVGEDLVRDLVGSKKESHSEEKQHLKAVGIMSNEDKTLAQVVGNYEHELGKIKNELMALQSLLSGEGSGGGKTSAEPEKQCKEQLKKLKDEFSELGGNLDTIADRLGQEVREEDDRSPAEESALAEVEEGEMSPANLNTANINELERLRGEIDMLRKLLNSEGNQENDFAAVVSEYEDELRTLRDQNAVLKKLISEGDRESVREAVQGQKDAAVQMPEESFREQLTGECVLEEDKPTDDRDAVDDLISLKVHIAEEPVISMPDREVIPPVEEQQQVQEEVIQASSVPAYGYSTYSPTVFGSLDDLGLSTTVLSDDSTPRKDDEKEEGAPDGTILRQRISELEERLQNETDLRKRYEQDVNDLLQDIMNLKMAQAEEEDEDMSEEKRKEIQEQFDAERENRRLKSELQAEKKRRTSVEESKRELLYELDNVMRRKEELEKSQTKKGEGERIAEELIKLRKTLADQQARNDALSKEVETLKEKFKESEEAFLTEKKHLIEKNEQEKAAMTKELLNAKGEVELKLHEQLRLNSELEIQVKNLERELAELKRSVREETQESVEGDLVTRDGQDEADKNIYEKRKNEALKEQLDDTEQTLKETIERYREQIRTMETERAKTEDELRHENELLTNKLEIEKSFAQQQKDDFDDIVRRERERLKEELERESEREKEKVQRDLEQLVLEHKTREESFQEQLDKLESQFQDEKNEMTSLFSEEKRRLQQTFDEEFREKIENERKKLDNVQREMESELRKQEEEMRGDLEKEKSDLKAEVEKEVYEKLIKRNEEMEKEFQETLSKVLKEHADEIKVVENEIKTVEERHYQETKRLLEEKDKDRKRLTAAHQQEKNAYEITVQNLLKEIVKLKQQRKELRMNYKAEQQKTEEAFEKENSEQQERWDKGKKELVKKLQEEHSKTLEEERSKFETNINELRQELKSSEEGRKVLEERLREETKKVLQSEESNNKKSTEAGDTVHIDVKMVRKTLEEEYERKIRDEKRKHEENLQGLRREVASLQEKRRLIQEKVYNQEASSERHVIEKSIANYKKEVLSKLEEEFSRKLQREKRPLEEANNELRREIDELEEQRRELKLQLRKEQARFEDELERERERLEDQFLKEKEDMKAKLENRLLQEYSKKTSANKVSRALSPIALVSETTASVLQ